MLGLGNSIITGGVLEEAAWTPASLGSTMFIWYKNDTGLSNGSGTDGTSANRLQWSDQSGNDNHVIQDTTADKPAISEGGLDFEVSETDFMSFTTPFDFDHPKPFTLFFVVKRGSISAQTALIGSNTQEFISFSSSDDKVKVRGKSGTVEDNVTVTFATSGLWETGVDFIFTITKDSSGNLLFYKDGAIQVESGGGTSVNDSSELDVEFLGKKISTTHNFDGIMKEIVMCDTVLSSGDRNSTITYLKDKFSIS